MNTLRNTFAFRLSLVFFAMLLLTASQLAGGSAQTGGFQVSDRYFNAVEDGSAFSLISPHSVLHTPAGTFAGPNSLVRFGEKLDASFDNVSFATTSTHSEGEYLLINFTFTGIHTGDYLGVGADCAGVAVPGVAVVHVGLSGITEQWISYDQDLMLNQINAYAQVDSSLRPTCESQGFTNPEAESPKESIWAPGCIAANRCNEPY